MAGRRPGRLRLRRIRRAILLAGPGRRRGRAAPAGTPGAAQRDAAHRAGPPRLRHRGDLPLRGGRGASRDARPARLRPLPGAHALQGHGPLRPGLRGPDGGRRGRPLERGDLVRLHVVLPRAAERRDRDGHRAPRRHGVPVQLRPRRDRPRARGHLRGGAHRAGQPAVGGGAPALRPGLRGQSLRPSRAGHPRDDAGGHPGAAARLQPPLLRAGEHDPGGGGAGESGNRARHRGAHVRAHAGHRLQARPGAGAAAAHRWGTPHRGARRAAGPLGPRLAGPPLGRPQRRRGGPAHHDSRGHRELPARPAAA